jgi:hypothetical protein
MGAHRRDDAEQHATERGERQRLRTRGEITVDGIDGAQGEVEPVIADLEVGVSARREREQPYTAA